MQLAVQESGDVRIVRVGESRLTYPTLSAFFTEVRQIVDGGARKLLIDLSAVTYIDSAGVGMVVSKLKTLRERGGDMKLLNLNLRGLRIFGITKLMFVFDTFDSEAMAVKSFEFTAR